MLVTQSRIVYASIVPDYTEDGTNFRPSDSATHVMMDGRDW